MIRNNQNLKDGNGLPPGMFGKLLAASIVSTVSICLLVFAILHI